MEITLNVFVFRTEAQAEQQEVGVEVPLEDCILEEHTFYNIDFIGPSFANKAFCAIASGGDNFVVNQSYLEVKELIRNVRISKFN